MDTTTISLMQARMPTIKNGSATSSRDRSEVRHGVQQLHEDEDQQQAVEHFQHDVSSRGVTQVQQDFDLSDDQHD